MSTQHRVVSIETSKLQPANHEVVVSIRTGSEAVTDEQQWTLKSVLQAMNGAQRFFTKADNGRTARVQRYTCKQCRREHIRTHISDGAIHQMTRLPRHATIPSVSRRSPQPVMSALP